MPEIIKDKYKCCLCSEYFELTKAEAKEMEDSGLDWICQPCYKFGMAVAMLAD